MRGAAPPGGARAIVSTDRFNHGPADLVIVLPLTKVSKGIPSHGPIARDDSGLDHDSFVIVEAKTRKHLHVLRETLAEMEVKLDPAIFVRIHRSTIVNAKAVQHVESVYRGEYVVTMLDGARFPSSRSCRERLEKALRIG